MTDGNGFEPKHSLWGRVFQAAVLAGLALVLSFTVFSGCLVMKYRTDLGLLNRMHLRIQKPLFVSIDDTFPVKARFGHDFAIRIQSDIPVRIPVAADLQIPIHETFSVPLDEPFSIKPDGPFLIDEMIHVKTDVPIDTFIETRIMGIKTKLPVKGVVPIDITFPLKQEIGMRGMPSMHMGKPLDVRINQTVQAPINFIVEGVLPLDQKIQAPISTDLDCSIRMRHDLPIVMDMDLSWADWGSSVKIGNY